MQKKWKLSDYGIPKTVKVGGFIYKVLFPYDFNEDNCYVGLHQTDDLIIKLSLNSPSHQSTLLPPQRVHEAFVHEVFHAIDYYFSDNSMEESEIDLLALTWHAIMRDNVLSVYKNVEYLPKKLKILNIVYDVEEHQFVDVEERAQSSNNVCKIQLPNRTKTGDKLHPLVQKCTLLTLVNFVVDNSLNMRFLKERSKENEMILDSFSNGLFQVLRENNIEEMVKNG